jgi:DNA polymerase elongation subunit (family B)
MNRVVFDIETLAYPLEHFDDQQLEYLLRFAKTEEEREDAILKLSLSPFTARIVAIAMLNPDSNRGKVYYDGPGETPCQSEDGLVEYAPLPEPEILQEFWKAIQPFSQFITFNGRTFDCPFVMLRSAALGIKPSRNLLPYRYSASEHCDLLDQLTFYGASRKFNLDFYCKAFGIKSPKAEGVTGNDIAVLHAEGRYRDIATYCIGDVKATAQLFQRWHRLLWYEK